MVSVKESTKIILQHALAFPVEKVMLENGTGRYLKEKIVADRDFPPYDRVMMDGIAIKSIGWKKGLKKYKIKGLQAAGAIPLTIQHEDECLEVMTGTVVPFGADTIIPYEEVDFEESNKEKYAFVRENFSVVPGKHIHEKGSDRKKNETLINENIKISPAEIGVMATVGKSEVKVAKFPKVAVIATGDELVPVNHVPEPHQIRQSNIYSLQSSLLITGIKASTFHLVDDKEILLRNLENILKEFDVLMLSGGVSKGKTDYLPEVMEILKVKKLFHRVQQRPGKPFWFGIHGERTTIFAFPGNPVSTFVGFYRYFLPWFRRSLGLTTNQSIQCILAEDFTFNPELTYFLQVKVEINEQGEIMAWPRPGKGSGDLANLINGFLELPADKKIFKKGEVYPLMLYRDSIFQ